MIIQGQVAIPLQKIQYFDLPEYLLYRGEVGEHIDPAFAKIYAIKTEKGIKYYKWYDRRHDCPSYYYLNLLHSDNWKIYI